MSLSHILISARTSMRTESLYLRFLSITISLHRVGCGSIGTSSAIHCDTVGDKDPFTA